MSSLTLQWHITNRCNKRCKHCYQEDYKCEEMPIKELFNIVEQYKELLDEYNKKNSICCKGHINITGGEPFIRDDIFELLDYLKFNRDKFTFGILTNGSFLTEEVVKRLKDYRPRIVQVSLDGNKEMHDNIRGEGSYDEVIKAIKLLKKYDIKSLVSFTANNENYKCFPDVVKAARKAKAYKVWTDRMVPIGSSLNKCVNTLEPKEVEEYLNILRKEKEKFLNRHTTTKIAIERSLQFLCGEQTNYKCNAGKGLIIVTENGDVMPCRRLPIIVGNVNDTSLRDIYYNSDVMNDLRKDGIKPKGCEKCKFLSICNGGAKCISFGVYGSYRIGDYGCPIKSQ